MSNKTQENTAPPSRDSSNVNVHAEETPSIVIDYQDQENDQKQTQQAKGQTQQAKGQKQQRKKQKQPQNQQVQVQQGKKKQPQNQQLDQEQDKTQTQPQEAQAQVQADQKQQEQEPKDQQRRRRNSGIKKNANTSTTVQFDNPQKRKQAARKQIVQMKLSQKQSSIFSHLPQYERPSSVSLASRFTEIHPAIISLGLKYADKQIQGSSARCLAMLDAFEIVINDYEISTDKKLSMDLDAKMKPLIQFLTDCRPLSVGMGNTIKTLKKSIAKSALEPKTHDPEAKQEILDDLSRYRKALLSAGELIEYYGVNKIHEGDVILVYAASYIVERILCKAHTVGKNFTVIVVDSNPKYEGRTLLSRLVSHGIRCTYVLVSAVSYIIKEVSKVFLGAHSLLSNGAVVSRTGSAVVAMMAHANNVPVLVACETFKFHERAQLDSICWNELENPDELLTSQPAKELEGWKNIKKLILLNLTYDLTPMDHVSVVVTEVGLIPPTSVPVVIREAQQKSELLTIDKSEMEEPKGQPHVGTVKSQ